MQTTQPATAERGSTGVEITRVGFGAWAIGGGGRESGWGPHDDEESIATIHHDGTSPTRSQADPLVERGLIWCDSPWKVAENAARALGYGNQDVVAVFDVLAQFAGRDAAAT